MVEQNNIISSRTFPFIAGILVGTGLKELFDEYYETLKSRLVLEFRLITLFLFAAVPPKKDVVAS